MSFSTKSAERTATRCDCKEAVEGAAGLIALLETRETTRQRKFMTLTRYDAQGLPTSLASYEYLFWSKLATVIANCPCGRV